MKNSRQFALLAAIYSTARSQGITEITDQLNQPIADCSNFFVGTLAELNDVILDGDITPDYTVPKIEFPM